MRTLELAFRYVSNWKVSAVEAELHIIAQHRAPHFSQMVRERYKLPRISGMQLRLTAGSSFKNQKQPQMGEEKKANA